MPPLALTFVLSADSLRRLPDSQAEVAFIGRSNVGKSSIINAVAGRKALAHTSKTPGRTQLLNCFDAGGGRTVVDCPGYGYASVSARTRASWQQMIEGYLLDRDALRQILVLVDGEIGPTKLDVQTLDWLESHGRPHVVVATKHDKVKSSQRSKRMKELAAGCRREPREIVWVSATKGTGIEKLRGLIHGWLWGDGDADAGGF